MAIGDFNQNGSNNGNNNNGKLFENTYYSRQKIKNATSKLNLNISFRSGLMIFEISEFNGSSYNSLQAIHLSPTKATILASEIRNFKNYLESGHIVALRAFGVNAGMNEKISFIGFHVTPDKIIKMTIGKMNGSTGEIIEQCTMDLNNDYHFSLEWNNIEDNDVEKCYINSLEIDQIEQICSDFGRHMNGAIAYSVADLTKFDTARVLKKMDPIYDKLGIERRTNNGYNGAKGSSFLDSRNSTSNHMSYDSIEDQIGYDED